MCENNYYSSCNFNFIHFCMTIVFTWHRKIVTFLLEVPQVAQEVLKLAAMCTYYIYGQLLAHKSVRIKVVSPNWGCSNSHLHQVRYLLLINLPGNSTSKALKFHFKVLLHNECDSMQCPNKDVCVSMCVCVWFPALGEWNINRWLNQNSRAVWLCWSVMSWPLSF